MRSNKYNKQGNSKYTTQHSNQHISMENPKNLKDPSVKGNKRNAKPSTVQRLVGQQRNTTEKSGAEDVMQLFENVCKHLSNGNFEPAVIAAVVHLNAGLKIYGAQLESLHKAKLEEFTGILRKACRQSNLDLVARLQLLEIIEMRGMKWEPNETIDNYYKHKVSQVENSIAREALDYVNNTATFDIKTALAKSLASTSKGLNPYAPDFTPVLTARYLLKASDSLANMLHLGNGIETSPEEQADYSSNIDATKTGSPKKVNFSPESMHQSARIFKKDKETMISMASPSGDPKASGDGSFIKIGHEYQATVYIADNPIKVLGDNQELVKAAKLAIQENLTRLTKAPKSDTTNSAFASSQILGVVDSTLSRNVQPSSALTLSPSKRRSPKKRVSISEDIEVVDSKANDVESSKANIQKYDRKALLNCADSPFSKIAPITWSDDWDHVRATTPTLFRYDMILGVDVPTSKRSENMPPIPDVGHEVKFSAFVQSMTDNTDKSSPDASPHAEQHVAKIDNVQNKFKLGPQGPVQTWDEFKDQWVEVVPGSHS